MLQARQEEAGHHHPGRQQSTAQGGDAQWRCDFSVVRHESHFSGLRKGRLRAQRQDGGDGTSALHDELALGMKTSPSTSTLYAERTPYFTVRCRQTSRGPSHHQFLHRLFNLSQVIANDKGEVVVRPRGMWEGEPVHGKLAGPNSSMPPNCEQPDLLVGTYTFDCLKGIMESEDTDRNRFVLDVTKTTFLREDFSISREGGSTADAANSPTAHKEKAEKNKRSSSRPSSGKVGMTQEGEYTHCSSSQCHTVLTQC